jgi:hypothetical protein
VFDFELQKFFFKSKNYFNNMAQDILTMLAKGEGAAVVPTTVTGSQNGATASIGAANLATPMPGNKIAETVSRPAFTPAQGVTLPPQVFPEVNNQLESSFVLTVDSKNLTDTAKVTLFDTYDLVGGTTCGTCSAGVGDQPLIYYGKDSECGVRKYNAIKSMLCSRNVVIMSVTVKTYVYQNDVAVATADDFDIEVHAGGLSQGQFKTFRLEEHNDDYAQVRNVYRIPLTDFFAVLNGGSAWKFDMEAGRKYTFNVKVAGHLGV